MGETDQESCEFFAAEDVSLSSLKHKDVDSEGTSSGSRREAAVTVVPMRTLDSVLKEAGSPQQIDFVSIDVEGAELRVLRGFSIDHYRPRVILLEANSRQERNQLSSYLAPFGYFLAKIHEVNCFYVRSRRDAWRLKRAKAKINIIHTPRPFSDQIDDRTITVKIDRVPLLAAVRNRVLTFSKSNPGIL
jgi:hypothetical protein